MASGRVANSLQPTTRPGVDSVRRPVRPAAIRSGACPVKRLPAISALILLLTLLAGGASEPGAPAAGSPGHRVGTDPARGAVSPSAGRSPRAGRSESRRDPRIPVEGTPREGPRRVAIGDSAGEIRPQLRECVAASSKRAAKAAAERVQQVRYQCVGLRLRGPGRPRPGRGPQADRRAAGESRGPADRRSPPRLGGGRFRRVADGGSGAPGRRPETAARRRCAGSSWRDGCR